MTTIVGRLKGNKGMTVIFGEMLSFNYDESNDCIIPRDQGGFIPTRDDLNELLGELSRFYESMSDAEIEEYNQELYSKKFSREGRETKQKEKTVRKYAGYVYLIKAENGLYKIGKARNLSERMKPFYVNFPMTWYMVHHIFADDYSAAEKTLHERYATKRDVGEWFRLDSEDVNTICGFMSYEDGRFKE